MITGPMWTLTDSGGKNESHGQVRNLCSSRFRHTAKYVAWLPCARSADSQGGVYARTHLPRVTSRWLNQSRYSAAGILQDDGRGVRWPLVRGKYHGVAGRNSGQLERGALEAYGRKPLELCDH